MNAPQDGRRKLSDQQRPTEASRIQELEILLTHQQHLLDQLNQVVTDQATRIGRIEQRLSTMKTEQEQLRDRVSEQSPAVSDEKPPHY